MSNKSNNCHCRSFQKKRLTERNHLPLIATLFIAILPKCPFCILAYSSAVTLCSGNKIIQDPGWGSWFCLSLAGFTLLMILLNYRGRRTWFAAGLVTLGSFFLIRTEWFTADINEYYLGVFLLLFGIWYNGNFLYFYKTFIQPLFNKQNETIQRGEKI